MAATTLNFNLLPWRFYVARKTMLRWIAACAFSGLMLFVMFFSWHQHLVIQIQKKSHHENSEFAQKKSYEAKKDALIQSYFLKRLAFTNELSTIAASMPTHTHLKTFLIQKNKIVLTGDTQQEKEISEFEKALSASNCFKSVVLNSLSQNGNDQSFTVKISLR